ncbi:biliverdin-producing heme oxygenase [Bernardetia sp.]|uniref:biliverdin-producing heme oxygenase n=1 Tax=Bernardetia sp. TaxID=1937974 RepID=UPI0025B908E6|nr:biliverdin-producing heme oxygenase [Bernardetia sp.]
MPILQTVRKETRSQHNLMENLIGSDRLEHFSVKDYELLLGTHFIFHSHLEEEIRVFLAEKSNQEVYQELFKKLSFEEHIKSVSLENELKQILPPAKFDALKAIPNTVRITDYCMLLGRMYVAEGSMLGGKIMYKIFSQNAQLNSVTKFDFFKNYEIKTPRLWNSFKKIVEEECESKEAQKLFLEGVELSYFYFEKSFHKCKNILQ